MLLDTPSTHTAMTSHAPVRFSDLRMHLSDFPVPHAADLFERHAAMDLCEIDEDAMQIRAQQISDACVDGFHRLVVEEEETEQSEEPKRKKTKLGQGPALNTVVAVVHTPLGVSQLLSAANDEPDPRHKLGRAFVIRLKDYFLVMLTTASDYSRFPFLEVLRKGVHGSTFIWVNVKHEVWEHVASGTKKTAPYQKRRRVFKELSQASICGMHFISFAWSKCSASKALATAAAGGLIIPYLHVRPSNIHLSDAWLRDVDQFANQFNQGLRDTIWCESFYDAERNSWDALEELINAGHSGDAAWRADQKLRQRNSNRTDTAWCESLYDADRNSWDALEELINAGYRGDASRAL